MTSRATTLASLRQPHPTPARIQILLAAAACLTLALATGCKVQVQKGADGEDKNVKVDTPFGGVHVNTDQTTASDLGLPVYPGAQLIADNDNNKSADIHLGFGQWELRVKAVSYLSTDSEDKVTAFYKSALSRYGAVISCRDDKPVGTPTVTSEGLTCSSDDSDNSKVKVEGENYGADKNGIELKAGSKRHQHIVGFKNSTDGKTHFALVEVTLPEALESRGKSD